ncbi:DUF3570 domain-containing protein [Ideonella sp. 4Y16]|uniref:DUF3570 domain-containing protein n=1 Tax=Ideonella alba TaxID=2824118 RepID=UPI001B382621|nr:DUF3570 domain-containing protein [Ideonella alba]MBQ0943889.1 DUF3570 domain-containing protein [Ideonella alba]
MAATDTLRRVARLLARALGLGGGALLAPAAQAVDLPPDGAEALIHIYNGGGVRAIGPALLVRKSIADRVQLSGQLYVDAVSNASIDVVTTASPFKETRTELGVGVDHAVRDTLLHLGLTNSTEPDYTARTLSADISQEVWSGMATVSLGFSRGADQVKRHGDPGFADEARHWQWRAGWTQVLSPRWLAALSAESLADDGYLGSPYRAARVFGALVPERVPRSRSGQAVKLRVQGDLSSDSVRQAMRAEGRLYRDNWGIQAVTLEGGYSRYLGSALGDWLAEGFVRLNRQQAASFYSDDATRETLYVSRNRQLGSFTSTSLGAKASRAAGGRWQDWNLRLGGSLELVNFRHSDYTDLRSGAAYRFTGLLLQVQATGSF